MDKQSKLNVFKCLTLFIFRITQVEAKLNRNMQACACWDFFIMKCLDMPQLVPINIVDKIVKTSRED